MQKILTCRKLRRETKVRFAKCYVWSTFLYACETWTLTACLEKKIDAFEMWTYRRILKIPWTRRKTNIDVLIDVGVRTRRLLAEVKQRKMRYYGHARRHNNIQKMVMEGKIEGKRSRGKQRNNWLENVKTITGKKMKECCEIAMEREEWRTMVSNLCRETEPR